MTFEPPFTARTIYHTPISVDRTAIRLMQRTMANGIHPAKPARAKATWLAEHQLNHRAAFWQSVSKLIRVLDKPKGIPFCIALDFETTSRKMTSQMVFQINN